MRIARGLEAPEWAVQVRAGTEVDISVEGGNLIVRPVVGPRYRMRTLLDGVTARNRHGEIDTGERIGREAW